MLWLWIGLGSLNGLLAIKVARIIYREIHRPDPTRHDPIWRYFRRRQLARRRHLRWWVRHGPRTRWSDAWWINRTMHHQHDDNLLAQYYLRP